MSEANGAPAVARLAAVSALLAVTQACGAVARDTAPEWDASDGGPVDTAPDGGTRDTGSNGGSSIPDPSPDARVPTRVPVATADLPFDVVDAAYSSALDRLVIASKVPTPALYLVDPSSLVATAVPLPLAPTCVSVAPDGLSAAAGDDGQVTWVDLVNASINRRCYVGPTIRDIALANGGRAYTTGAFPGIRGSDLTACLDLSPDEFVKPNNAQLGVDGVHSLLYAAQNNTSSDALHTYDISAGRPVPGVELDYTVSFGDCGEVWMADDGRGFLRCGAVLENRTIRRLALPFQMIAAVAASATAVLIVPDQDPVVWKGRGVPYAYVYDERLNPVGKIDFAKGQEGDPPLGRYAFGRAANDRWYVITARGMPPRYALATINTVD